MRAAGRPGRGERARVAARVRDLIAGPVVGDPSAARTERIDPRPTTPPVAPEESPGDSTTRPGQLGWRPGGDFDRPVPRHGAGRAARSRWRWDPGRRGLAALGAAVLVVLAATGWWLFSSRPQELPVSATPASGGAVGPTSTPAASLSAGPSSVAAGPSAGLSVATRASLVVDVAGKVRRPGIYRLAAGARVYDALRAAGGPRRGVSTVSLNLAEPLHDGEQVVVGVARGPAAGGGADGAASSGTAGQTSGASELVDLNTASLEQLETLPGVGPVLGQNILDWRAAHGRFANTDQLGEVNGIGDKRLAQLRPLVTV